MRKRQKISEETRAKMRASSVKRWAKPEEREKDRQSSKKWHETNPHPMKGKHLTEEQKDKLRGQRVERIEVECNYCGKSLPKMPCEIKKSNGGKFYCDKDCRRKNSERKKAKSNEVKKRLKKEAERKRKQVAEDNPLITYDVLYGLYVDQEMTEQQISKLLGRGVGTVHRYLTEVHKIPTRSVSDYYEDLVDIKFGDREVLSLCNKAEWKSRQRLWNTVCKCGEKQKLTLDSLKKTGACEECNIIKKFESYVGQQISFLTIKEYLGWDSIYSASEGRYKRVAKYLCVCVCGEEVTRYKAQLLGGMKNGIIQSCGCCAGLKNYGEDNHNWRGGKSGQRYCELWKSKEFKDEITERDGNKCLGPDCRKNCDHLPLFRHHIDGNPLNCHPSNLITVCCSCNFRAEGSKEKSRDEWQAEYQQIMSSLYGYEYEQQLSLLEAVNQ